MNGFYSVNLIVAIYFLCLVLSKKNSEKIVFGLVGLAWALHAFRMS
jgi:hypothetical protein